MHINNGDCPGCEKIFNRFPGFHEQLKDWFKCIQVKFPEAHISCAGRGRDDQEACFRAGTSKNHYGESAHNFNAALDIFFQISGELHYDRALYLKAVEPFLTPALVWFGSPGAKFPELPHVQLAGWKGMNLKLVEP